MPAKTQTHKKIYQVAKEINISHETLIEYLTRKGHTVKSHMTSVDDGMMHDILSHFKKDREVAEKHQRKIQTIRETRKKAEAKAAVSEPELKAKTLRKAKPEEAEPAPAPPKAAPAEKHAPAPEVVAEAAPVEAKAVSQPPDPATPRTVAPAEAAEKPPVKEKKPAPEIMARRTPKMGLRIKGKIDLDEGNRTNATSEGTPAAETPTAGADEEEHKRE